MRESSPAALEAEEESKTPSMPPIKSATPVSSQAKLGGLPCTPVKSTLAPDIAPRLKLQKNTNKKQIRNALQQLVLAGGTEAVVRERQAVLAVIDGSDHAQYVLQFKGATGRFDFKALYAVTGEDGKLTQIYGNNVGLVAGEKNIGNYYKYNTVQRTFQEL